MIDSRHQHRITSLTFWFNWLLAFVTRTMVEGFLQRGYSENDKEAVVEIFLHGFKTSLTPLLPSLCLPAPIPLFLNCSSPQRSSLLLLGSSLRPYPQNCSALGPTVLCPQVVHLRLPALTLLHPQTVTWELPSQVWTFHKTWSVSNLGPSPHALGNQIVTNTVFSKLAHPNFNVKFPLFTCATLHSIEIYYVAS